MDCREAERFVDLRLDGEIEPSEGALLEDHLARCSTCRSSFQVKGAFLAHVREKLHEAAEQERTPPGLRTRIVARVNAASPAERFAWGRAVPATLGISMIAVLSWSWTSGPPLVPDETVARHSINLPPEVRAGDVGRVQSFLQQNLRYPVAVPRFEHSNPNVKLVGARLSSFDDREAAYMMYDHRGAKLSLFAYPKPHRFSKPNDFREVQAGARTLLVGQRRGYNVVAWENGDVVYSMVSDLDPRELVDLAAASE
jgi:anti-sigma factor RsiW